MKQILVRQYPKLIEEFARENFNLKALTGALIAVTFINSIVLAYVLRRGPLVVPLQADGSVARIDFQVTEAQVAALVKEYLNTRYTWTDSTIASQLKRAEFLIAPELIPSFQKALMDTAKYVHEKKVTQRVYLKTIEINFKDRLIQVVTDRFTEFDGLKAASEMRLSLNFEIKNRTVINPWGVYISKETEKASQ